MIAFVHLFKQFAIFVCKLLEIGIQLKIITHEARKINIHAA